jgi:hypothetical protein
MHVGAVVYARFGKHRCLDYTQDHIDLQNNMQDLTTSLSWWYSK